MQQSFSAAMIPHSLQSHTNQHSCSLLTMATGCTDMKQTKFCWMESSKRIGGFVTKRPWHPSSQYSICTLNLGELPGLQQPQACTVLCILIFLHRQEVQTPGHQQAPLSTAQSCHLAHAQPRRAPA